MTRTTTIRGIVIPDAWNERGDVISVAVLTYDERKYRVDADQKQPLLSLLRQRVVVKGTLIVRDNIDVIEVADFRQDIAKT